METHSSGLSRKRKRRELNGQIKEEDCVRKAPRKTLVRHEKLLCHLALKWWHHFLCTGYADHNICVCVVLEREGTCTVFRWTGGCRIAIRSCYLWGGPTWNSRCVNTYLYTASIILIRVALNMVKLSVKCSQWHTCITLKPFLYLLCLFRGSSCACVCWWDFWHVPFRTRPCSNAGQVSFSEHASHCWRWVWIVYSVLSFISMSQAAPKRIAKI